MTFHMRYILIPAAYLILWGLAYCTSIALRFGDDLTAKSERPWIAITGVVVASCFTYFHLLPWMGVSLQW